MKALVVESVGHIAIKDMPFPKPGPGQVTIKVEACGLCGTDVHIYNGEYLSSYPVIPGHEFSGVVAEVGAGVTNWRAGDRVTADPNIFCHDCYFCKTDHGNHCLNWRGVGVTVAGAMAEYCTVPQENVYKIADELDFTTAAFIEPISCVVFGLRRLQAQTGDHALIFGAGPIGLLHTQLLARGGTASVTVVDVAQDRLALAKQLGASRCVLAGKTQDETLMQIAPLGFDVVLDATGVPAVVENTLQYAKRGGKVLFFGVCPKDAKISISPFEVFNRDLTILGSYALRYTFYYAHDLLANGIVNVKPLLSHQVDLEGMAEILEHPERFPNRMKIIVKP